MLLADRWLRILDLQSLHQRPHLDISTIQICTHINAAVAECHPLALLLAQCLVELIALREHLGVNLTDLGDRCLDFLVLGVALLQLTNRLLARSQVLPGCEHMLLCWSRSDDWLGLSVVVQATSVILSMSLRTLSHPKVRDLTASLGTRISRMIGSDSRHECQAADQSEHQF